MKCLTQDKCVVANIVISLFVPVSLEVVFFIKKKSLSVHVAEIQIMTNSSHLHSKLTWEKKKIVTTLPR